MQKTATGWPTSDDLMFGPGATRLEKGLAYLGGLALIGYVIWLDRTGAVDWTLTQLLVAVVIALDLGSGAVANALEPCARYYSEAKPGEPGIIKMLKNPLVFNAIHVYPLVVGIYFGPNNWLYGLVGYAAMMLASLLVIRAPHRLQRPIAYLATALVIVFFPLLLPAPTGFDWLMPLLFLKIVAGHSVAPEPLPAEKPATSVSSSGRKAARAK